MPGRRPVGCQLEAKYALMQDLDLEGGRSCLHRQDRADSLPDSLGGEPHLRLPWAAATGMTRPALGSR